MEKEESWTRKEDVRRGFGFWPGFFWLVGKVAAGGRARAREEKEQREGREMLRQRQAGRQGGQIGHLRTAKSGRDGDKRYLWRTGGKL